MSFFVVPSSDTIQMQNAFSKKLSTYGFDIFKALVVDLMHEVESENWRSLFIHLLRILDCGGGASLITKMDSRYIWHPLISAD